MMIIGIPLNESQSKRRLFAKAYLEGSKEITITSR
jgi:hypothetical protein